METLLICFVLQEKGFRVQKFGLLKALVDEVRGDDGRGIGHGGDEFVRAKDAGSSKVSCARRLLGYDDSKIPQLFL